MVIWFVLLGIAGAAIGLMIVPLWLRKEEAPPRAAFDAQVYRDQLTEVEIDAERERITPDQAASARIEIARHLLATTSDENRKVDTNERPTAEGAKAAPHVTLWNISIFVALTMPIAAFGVYQIVGSPHLPARPAAEMQAQRPMGVNPAHANGHALVAQLGKRLRGRPNDLPGWMLYARSLVRLGRFDDAVAAYNRLTTLAPQDAELMSRMAETQIFAANGSVTPAAIASLRATISLDPSEPRARYYLGLAKSQAGKVEAALSIWIALEADSAPAAPWRTMLAERIAQLASRGKISADQLAARRSTAATTLNIKSTPARQVAQRPRGPTAGDVKAAQSMAPKERMEMIRGMVARLADRLKNQPNDHKGWAQLARSYDVLGETEKAREARARLEQLRSARASPRSFNGPTTKDIKAAQSMAPKERMEMIRGMVARLADRLKNQPNDLKGWAQLARSYDVLSETEKAREAYGHLAKQLPYDVKALTAYADAIARTVPKGAAIPPELVSLGNRILTIDANHTGALWFTGTALARAGDNDGARERWTRLLAELDPKSAQYVDVEKRIEALGKSRR